MTTEEPGSPWARRDSEPTPPGDGGAPRPEPASPPASPAEPASQAEPWWGTPWAGPGEQPPAAHPATAAHPEVAPRGNRRVLAGLVALVLVSAGVGGGVGAAVRGGGTTTVVQSAGLKQGTDSAASAVSPAASGTVAAVARTILPSVVTIQETSNTEAGTGSGVILRSDGYILTNNHVVSAAAAGGTVTVTLQDGKTYPATIKGRDPSSDLAVIKIAAGGLTAVTIGNSDALGIGDLVVAVGAPLGLSGTVTSGIISALHRPVRTGDSSVTDTNAVLDAVQTDAPINPGNSGGALVNSKGELIGINSAIATVGGASSQQQSGNIGVGFAIPSNYAASIATQLINGGVASHPYLGVSASTAGQANSQTGDGTGAQVEGLVAGGPADKAGLKEGDVITAVGSRTITSVDGLIAAVRSHNIGETIAVVVRRGGQTLTESLTLAKQP